MNTIGQWILILYVALMGGSAQVHTVYGFSSLDQCQKVAQVIQQDFPNVRGSRCFKIGSIPK